MRLRSLVSLCGLLLFAASGCGHVDPPNFIQLPTVLASPVPLPTSGMLSAPSDRAVWMLVGGVELFVSQDRGATWRQQPLPAGVTVIGMSFIDEASGQLLGTVSPGPCDLAQVKLFATPPYWHPVAAHGVAAGHCPTDLTFADPEHDFVVATGSDTSPAPVVYRSSIEGWTWAASAPLPDPPGTTWQAGALAGRLQSFGATQLVQVGRYVYHSQDGGATWKYLATAPGGATSLGFVTATRWLELIAPGQSRETLDAGATWHSYASDYAQAAPVAPEVVFANQQLGYATVRGALSRTEDGGLHWTRLQTPGTLG
jgi:photosystem II stability/assembly factor-like uncharacterized protein